MRARLNALDERVLVNEADLSKLNKLKISGYIQAQWLLNDKDHVTVNEPTNSFLIRRARIKFTYQALDGVKFVLQPDFSTGNLSLKDAYAVVNIPKLKDITLWAGQFNRTNYEVEYSSSQREVLERSKVIRALYPGEREVGVKLEYKGSEIPLKFQLMAMNGNFTGAQPVDYDSKKDLMGRLVYSIKLPLQELALTLDQISTMEVPGSNTIRLFLMKTENLTAQHTRQVIICRSNGWEVKFRYLPIFWEEWLLKVSIFRDKFTDK